MRKINLINSLVEKEILKINRSYEKNLSFKNLNEIKKKVLSNIKSIEDLKDLEDNIKEVLEKY